ncbi:MAG: site-2 protease family protein [bacterium]|nr:site-2 protease family protein [bacterium]
MPLFYRVVEGVIIASLWAMTLPRRTLASRKSVPRVLLFLLAGTAFFDLEVYKARAAEVTALVLLPPLVLMSVILHEVSHGWVALQLGDPTARNHGRLTFNPLKHMSFRWTVLFPITTVYLFGVALIMPKPVPINPNNFEDPRKGIMWVGLAGPAVNIFFMLFFSILLGSGVVPAHGVGSFIRFLLTALIIINMILATFNLLPIPPLDGSRLLIGLLPPKFGFYLIKGQRLGLGLIFAVVIGTAVFVGMERVFIPWIEFVWRFLGLDVNDLYRAFGE